MYYIEECDKPKFVTRFFNIIKTQNNKLILPIHDVQINENKSKKLAEKTNKVLKKTRSIKVVLSKNLHKNEMYKNILYYNNYDIVDGKWLYQAISLKILDYIVENKQINKEETFISILVNNLDEYTLENIKIMAEEYKSLNIVTNHIEKFKKIQEKLYEEHGIIITVTNNKKKSLIKSKIIINVDFSNELINKYNISEEAIIVNLRDNIKIDKKRFQGMIVNDYEIDTDCIEQSDKYYTKELYEAELYKNIPYNELQNKIKKDKVKIKFLYGINGRIL